LNPDWIKTFTRPSFINRKKEKHNKTTTGKVVGNCHHNYIRKLKMEELLSRLAEEKNETVSPK
jgi:hypothetical protein